VDIRAALRQAVIKLDLKKKGIIATRVGLHSLRAGGAMALKFAGAGHVDIKNTGRWNSDTFLMYIHDQIAEYSGGWTEKCPFQGLISIRKERSHKYKHHLQSTKEMGEEHITKQDPDGCFHFVCNVQKTRK